MARNINWDTFISEKKIKHLDTGNFTNASAALLDSDVDAVSIDINEKIAIPPNTINYEYTLYIKYNAISNINISCIDSKISYNIAGHDYALINEFIAVKYTSIIGLLWQICPP